MIYKGKFYPRNPSKYKGDTTDIIYRSSWELKFMKYCDMNSSIIEWASEEFFVPYRSPLDGRVHRYFPDFYMKVRQSSGQVTHYVVEIKPDRYTRPPVKKKRITKQFIREANDYIKNQAKWEAARKFCDDKNWRFIVLTEKELKL